MLTANHKGIRIPALPGIEDATCPHCGAGVTPKCGTINVWHWAHKNMSDCDTWAEPDTQWHLDWQQHVPASRREVTIGDHRADIVADDGTVVEIQHSHLSEPEIREREQHYGRMIWVFNATGHLNAWPEDDPLATPRLHLRDPGGKGAYRTFRWKHARKSIAACRQTVFLDLGNDTLLRIGRIHVGPPCGGWGHLFSKGDLITAIGGAR